MYPVTFPRFGMLSATIYLNKPSVPFFLSSSGIPIVFMLAFLVKSAGLIEFLQFLKF